jgi:replicative DNA helicase
MDPTRRSLFFVEAADVLGIDVHILQTAKAAAPSATKDAVRPQTRHHPKEFEFLSLLLNNPGAIDRAFEQVSPEDFESPTYARIYAAMAQQYRAKGTLKADSLINNLADEEATSLVADLGSVQLDPSKVDIMVSDHLRVLMERKRKRIRDKLTNELAAAVADGDQARARQITEELRDQIKHSKRGS